MKIQEKYVERCLQLAKNGLGNTYPNPMVGCVIVYEGKIIGEGWHHKAGEPHAEVVAIQSVKNKNLLQKSTLYVSLEPCSHFGKTPPCSDLIIAKNIKKVVIGTIDPFAKVAGRGIRKLIEAGCDVQVGIMEDACQTLNQRFFTFHKQQRPYVILKWAQTLDGFIAPQEQPNGKPTWISSETSKQLVHKWRSEEQAILVGTETAVKDNPQLNTRLWKGKNPVRIVLDRQLRIPKQAAVFDGTTKTILITDKNLKKDNRWDVEFIAKLSVETIDFEKEIAPQICSILHQHDLQSVIVEGGRQTLQTFIDAGLWDEARVFTGSTSFGKGIKAPQLPVKFNTIQNCGNDRLAFYKNPEANNSSTP